MNSNTNLLSSVTNLQAIFRNNLKDVFITEKEIKTYLLKHIFSLLNINKENIAHIDQSTNILISLRDNKDFIKSTYILNLDTKPLKHKYLDREILILKALTSYEIKELYLSIYLDNSNYHKIEAVISEEHKEDLINSFLHFILINNVYIPIQLSLRDKLKLYDSYKGTFTDFSDLIQSCCYKTDTLHYILENITKECLGNFIWEKVNPFPKTPTVLIEDEAQKRKVFNYINEFIEQSTEDISSESLKILHTFLEKYYKKYKLLIKIGQY